MLKPNPVITPVVTNNPGTLLVQKLAEISPTPLMVAPASNTLRPPYRRIKWELPMAKIDMQALASDPTNARVEGGASPSLTRAAWITPNEYDDPA